MDKETNNINTFNWCGIPLFDWESWNTVDVDCMCFYNSVWRNEDVKIMTDKYKQEHPEMPQGYKIEYDIFVHMNGKIQIFLVGEYHHDGNYFDSYEIYDGYIVDIPSVKTALLDNFSKSSS